MRIAFTAKGASWDAVIDPRFGRTEFLLVYDESSQELERFDNRDIENQAHGAGPKTAQNLFDLKPDVLITGIGPGGNAASALQQAGLQIFVGAGDMTVKQALEAYKNNQLEKF